MVMVELPFINVLFYENAAECPALWAGCFTITVTTHYHHLFYFQTQIATSGQISPQMAQPVHPPVSSQTAKKYPWRLISSPIRRSSFGHDIVQSPQPLQRSLSISILAIT
jgi:hypothetical protein